MTKKSKSPRTRTGAQTSHGSGAAFRVEQGSVGYLGFLQRLPQQEPELYAPFDFKQVKGRSLTLLDPAGKRVQKFKLPWTTEAARGILREFAVRAGMPSKFYGSPTTPPAKPKEIDVPGSADWALFPDGRALVGLEAVSLWHLDHGFIADLAGGFTRARLFAIGRYGAAADADHAVAWDLDTGAVVFIHDALLVGTDKTSRLFFSRGSTIDIRELPSGRQVGTLEMPAMAPERSTNPDPRIKSVDPAPGGSIVVETDGPYVALFDRETFRLKCSMAGYLEIVDDRWAYASEWNSRHREKWDLLTAERIVLPVSRSFRRADFGCRLPDGKRKLEGSLKDRTLWLVDLQTDQELLKTTFSDVCSFEDYNGDEHLVPPQIAVDLSGRFAVLHSTRLTRVDLESGQTIEVPGSEHNVCKRLVFRRNGTLLVLCVDVVQAWDIAAMKLIKTWTHRTGSFELLLTPPSGHVIAVAAQGAMLLDEFETEP